MANREKGETSLRIGDDTYTLALTLDAMVTLEEMFSTSDRPMFFPEIAGLAERGSVTHARALMWAMFQEHHPDVALKDVSKLVQRGGGIVAMGNVITNAIEASAPDPADAKALGAKNPPKARAVGKANGTGASSTSVPGASV